MGSASRSAMLGTLAAGDERICVAVLDGPVALDHTCFSGARLTVLDTAAGQAASGRALDHGTQVASLLFGQPRSPVEGLVPRCRGLIVPIFGGADSNGLHCSQLDLARAILLAVENGAHFINVSGGQLSPSGEAEPILAQAIERCATHNVLIVAAAGNDGCDCLHIPAAAPTVLAVGAADQDGMPLASSNWGATYRRQGLLAPGAGLLCATPDGGTARKSGTSFAAPYVTGIAALLAGMQVAAGQRADPQAIRAALLKTAKPCSPESAEDCRKILSGRIDVDAAIRELTGGEVAMFTTETQSAADLSVATPEIVGRMMATAMPPAAAGRAFVEMSSHETKASPTGETMPLDEMADVMPSDCGCGCGGHSKGSCGGEKAAGGGSCACGSGAPKKPSLVYALGRLGYDFGTEARRDSFIQAMNGGNPYLPDQLLAYLEAAPFDAPSLIWTLNLDATPIYAIQPAGPYAALTYERLREALRAQITEGVELVSIPGVVGGSVRLQSGQVVPMIVPAIRGIYSWSTEPLVAHVLGAEPAAGPELEAYGRARAGLTNFLDRVYYDLRNLGITAEERAINYSATNAIQVAAVIRSTTLEALDLDRLLVKKSPVCRPDSDCYDVELSFFNPNNTNVASRVYRFTVDVSDVIPVTIGNVRSWTRRV